MHGQVLKKETQRNGMGFNSGGVLDSQYGWFFLRFADSLYPVEEFNHAPLRVDRGLQGCSHLRSRSIDASLRHRY